MHASLHVAVIISCFLVFSSCALPSMWYKDYGAPLPNFVYAPFGNMHFQWSIDTSASPQLSLIGTFNFTYYGGYISVGTRSKSRMDGLMILCFPNQASGTATCEDYQGSGYDIEKRSTQRTTVISSTITGGVSGITFRHLFTDALGNNYGDIEMGAHYRTIWAYGPVEGGEPEEHPGEGIMGVSINWMTGEVTTQAGKSRLTIIYITIGVTAGIILVIQSTFLFKVQVHHRVRLFAAVFFSLGYFALFILYIVAAWNDYQQNHVLGPLVRAMGDGAAYSFCGLMLLVTRRFFFAPFLDVSHERTIKYHMVLGLLFAICIVWHAIGMSGMYFGPYLVRWTAADVMPKLPGLLASIFLFFVIAPALIRFYFSYHFFRLCHYLWILVVIFSCLHYTALFWGMLPALILIFLNLVWGRIVNWGVITERCVYDAPSKCIILEVKRRYHRYSSSSFVPVVRQKVGVDPAQWFYVGLPEVNSMSFHPFSVARTTVSTEEGTGKRWQHLQFVIKDTDGQGGGGGMIANCLNKTWEAMGVKEKVDQFRSWQSWTKAVCAFVKSMAPEHIPSVMIEGAFGSVQLPLNRYQNILLISGGIGVTPNLFMMQHLAVMAPFEKPGWGTVFFIWINRDESLLPLFAQDIVKYHKELTEAKVKVVVRLFVTQKPTVKEPMRSPNYLPPSFPEEGGTELQLVQPAATVDDESRKGDATAVTVVEKKAQPFPSNSDILEPFIIRGKRPNFDKEVTDFATAGKDRGDKRGAMYLCGPTPMIDSATQAANQHDATGFSVHVHSEVFDV